MRQKSHSADSSSEKLVKDIRRATRRQFSAEEKIRIVLDGLRGEATFAEQRPTDRCGSEHTCSGQQGTPVKRDMFGGCEGSGDVPRTVWLDQHGSILAFN